MKQILTILGKVADFLMDFFDPHYIFKCRIFGIVSDKWRIFCLRERIGIVSDIYKYPLRKKYHLFFIPLLIIAFILDCFLIILHLMLGGAIILSVYVLFSYLLSCLGLL